MTSGVPADREELLEEIDTLVEELGHTPRIRHLQEYDMHSSTAYYNNFGSWGNALREAGYRPHWLRPTREELLEELKRLAEKIGRSPRVQDVDKKSEYSSSAYYAEFGSWNNGLRGAGLTPNRPSKISDENLMSEIDRLAEGDEPPTYTEMDCHGKHPMSAYRRAFGTWTNAVREAGYEPHRDTDAEGFDRSKYDRGRYDNEWKEKSYEKREQDGECFDCGVTRQTLYNPYNESLHVHHISTDEYPRTDGGRLEEKGESEDEEEPKKRRPERLVTLCPDCHYKWENIGIGPDVRRDEEEEEEEGGTA